MATSPRSLRIRPHLEAEIERISRRTRRSFSQVAQDLIEEALRMRACPGIYFADETGGREAKVSGTGLAGWGVVRDFVAAGRGGRRLRKAAPRRTAAEHRPAPVPPRR